MALVLFDIDGTLLATRRAGVRSMNDAARELFGPDFSFDGVELAGRIDPLIWAEVAAANGIGDSAAHHDRFRAAYARHLESRLAADNTVSLMPGVAALLEALRRLEGITLGLLTGNYPETGRLKVEAAGLDPAIFPVGAFGCDSDSRRGLPAVAIARHAEMTGRRLPPRQVVVIGDTPHDVDCARAAGCRSIAVATGTYTRDKLAPCGADLLVDDLSGTTSIVNWIVRG